LLSHAGAGHQLKINKAATGDTASLLLQSDWIGRAEMGLAGNNDFSIKMSADGASWVEAVRVNAQTGRITGTAVQSGPTDSAAERLLKVGAFGLGTAVSLTATDDLDDALLSGLYYNPSASNTSGNNYPMSVAGAVLVIARSSTNVVQEYTTFAAGGAAADVRKFVRSYGLSAWSPWVEVLHSGRLLGTVSQSGGVPTGKVIERGSNANGEYVRFADGTQICWGAAASAGDGLGAINTLPAAFVNTGYRVSITVAGNAPRIFAVFSNTTTSFRAQAYFHTGGVSSSFGEYIAIGRWF
jgi:hypothetical protein